MDKVRENRLRRVLLRRGFILKKSRRRDPDALGFGKYNIVNLRNCVVVGGDDWERLTLDEVEEWLTPSSQKGRKGRGK